MEPPPLPATGSQKFFANLLSLFLGLLVTDALLGFIQTLCLLFRVPPLLGGLQSTASILFMVVGLGVYSCLGLFPQVPKRYVLPVLFLQILELLVHIPFEMFHLQQLLQDGRVEYPLDLAFSLARGLLGVWLIHRLQAGWQWRWPLFPVSRLSTRPFSWWTLSLVVLASLVLLVGLIAYLLLCTALVSERLSDDFIAVHFNRVALREKTYTRSDGKTIELIPMMHIGPAAFYQQVLSLIPSDASVLMEGVSDRRHLLPGKIDYRALAEHWNLTTQRDTLKIPQEAKRSADLDVSDFSPSTIRILTVLTALSSDYTDVDAFSEMGECLQAPEALSRLKEDLLVKRNAHLISELDQELLKTSNVALPWGAAHMPGLAAAVEKEGFQVSSTCEIPLFYFFGSPSH